MNQTPLYATAADWLISAVTVTDPRHPLYGQQLAVLSLASTPARTALYQISLTTTSS